MYRNLRNVHPAPRENLIAYLHHCCFTVPDAEIFFPVEVLLTVQKLEVPFFQPEPEVVVTGHGTFKDNGGFLFDLKGIGISRSVLDVNISLAVALAGFATGIG